MVAMPKRVAPMRAMTGPVPTDDENWAFEVKWDGIRAITFIVDGRLRLQSSNLLDITDRWPELRPIVDELAGHEVILDGEIVTFDASGVPDFGLLQKRMHVGKAQSAAEWSAIQPAVLVLFDLCWLDGHDAMPLSYENRRKLLENLVEPGPNWQVPRYYLGDGTELLEAVSDRGMEGLMAKRLDSTYEAGRRSASWRKLKIRQRQEFVVGGWTRGDGGRSGTIGALVVGYFDHDGRLVYAGRVGSGLSADEIARLRVQLDRTAIDHCPFDPPPSGANNRDAIWVEPKHVIEVAFQNWSLDGHLRHPSYCGERFDKEPSEVRREQ